MQATIATAETQLAPVDLPAGLPMAEWPLFYESKGMNYHKPVGHSDKKSDALNVFMNHGRWMVQCPNCNEAQIASDTDRRFYCTSCNNQQAGRKAVDVVWPDQQTRFSLEKLMAGRAPQNMNWFPGETVDDIAEENRANGI